MDNIILIGFMGAGKTTIGKLLAENTGRTHVDFDEMLEAEIGCKIADYFAEFGEAAFRQQESELLKNFKQDNHVISTGGGIVLQPENRRVLQSLEPVIYLKADPKVFIPRLQADQENVRPLVLAKTPAEIEAVYRPRIPLYEASATFTIDTANLTPTEVVEKILQQLDEK